MDEELWKQLDSLKPWERRQGESHTRYAAFRAWRDSLPAQRSPAKVARLSGCTVDEIEAWHGVDDWAFRTECYDRWSTALFEREQEHVIRAAARDRGTRLAKVQQAAFEASMQALERFAYRERNTPMHANTAGPLSAKEALAFYEFAEKLTPPETQNQFNFENLTDDELLEFERLRNKASRHGSG